ncbi:MAG: hypothetical protein ABSH36_07795 [Solirubrobacteraceae bacterium]
MPLSARPAARARQLANLQPGAGAGDGGLARAKTHGAYARVAAADLEAQTRRIFDALAADAPVRADDGGLPREDTLAVAMLAEVLVRLRRVGDFLLRRGLEDEDGDLRPATDLELRLRGQALDLCRELGMTPKSRAALGVDLVRVATAGDRLQEHLAATYGDTAGEPIEATSDDDVIEDAKAAS